MLALVLCFIPFLKDKLKLIIQIVYIKKVTSCFGLLEVHSELWLNQFRLYIYVYIYIYWVTILFVNYENVGDCVLGTMLVSNVNMPHNLSM